MNRNSSLIALILTLASCASVKEAPTKVAYLNATSSELTSDESRGFDRIPGAEVGFMYGGEGDESRAVGVVSDISLRVGDLEDSAWGGENVTLRSLGLKTGLRYYLDTGSSKLQPYLGAAVLAQRTWFSTDLSGDKAEASSLGFLGSVGIESQLSRHLRLNLGYSLTGGMSAKVDDEKIDLDNGSFMIGLGWSF